MLNTPFSGPSHTATLKALFAKQQIPHNTRKERRCTERMGGGCIRKCGVEDPEFRNTESFGVIK